MIRLVRGLAHFAAIVALAAWALALGRWLRDPTVGGGIGLALVLVVVLAGARRLYGAGGLVALRPAPAGRPPDVAAAPEPAAPPPLFDGRVDLNSAGVEDLVALPGVGRVAAQRIVDEREANGPFATVEALVRVPGFGPAKVRALADRARVG